MYKQTMSIKPGYVAVSSLFALAAAMQWQTFRQEEKVVNNVQNLLSVSAFLGDVCTSKERRTVEKCTAALMGSTVGVANALETYLDKHNPGHGSSRVLAADCSLNFEAIFLHHEFMTQVYDRNKATGDFLQEGLSGSRQCLQTIRDVAADYNLNYMPSLVSFLYRKINDAENGKTVIGWHA